MKEKGQESEQTHLEEALEGGVVGSGKTLTYWLVAAELVNEIHVLSRELLDEAAAQVTAEHDLGKASPVFPGPARELFQRPGPSQRAVLVAESARRRFRRAAQDLRTATAPVERRAAARAFLVALEALVAALLGFLAAVLLLLLSRRLSQLSADDIPVWTPVPLERTPEITPRGPNSAFPVNTHRGGHHRSTLGSVVLAA
ncbi:hypothetical protein GCM10018987_61140 [Streptomyces cremeus]